MAASTHRWRPAVAAKSGYSFRTPLRKIKTTARKTERCVVEVKFEKSRYFEGSGARVAEVFRETGADASKAPFFVSAKMTEVASKQKDPRESLAGRLFSIGTEDFNPDTLMRKLYASEYVESKAVKYLTKLKDPLIRSYIISNDASCVEEAINCLELIKLNLHTEDWLSLRIIVIEKHFDIKKEILSTGEKVASQKNFVIKAKKEEIEEDSMEDMDGGDENMDDRIENDSSNTLFDEDEETRMISKMAKSKFRDSRIIIKSKSKPVQPDIDPIERCFLALMKMLEDNIFSATKGLSEVEFQITQILKESNFDEVKSEEEHHIKIFKI